MAGAPKRESTKSNITWTLELRTVVFLLRTAFEYDHKINARIFRHMYPVIAGGYNNEQLTYRIKDEYNGRKYAGRAVKAWAAICARSQSDEVLQWREDLKEQIRAAVATIQSGQDTENAVLEDRSETVADEAVPHEAIVDENIENKGATDSTMTKEVEDSQKVNQATTEEDNSNIAKAASPKTVLPAKAAEATPLESASPAKSDPGHLPMPPSIARTKAGKGAQEAWRRVWNLANS